MDLEWATAMKKVLYFHPQARFSILKKWFVMAQDEGYYTRKRGQMSTMIMGILTGQQGT